MRLLPCLLLAFASPLLAQDAADGERSWGHSAHGPAFDEGPRQKPWKMEDIGSAPFLVTTTVPEVQEWFDQGNALLHSFWYYEAERAFRWCVTLDPDCAMGWWALARAAGTRRGNERMEPFLEAAVERKHLVTDRERMYIEAWERAYLPELSGDLAALDEQREPFAVLVEELEQIALKYPLDVEARALLGLYALGRGPRYSNEQVLNEVLAQNRLHPGAHHYLIHNWDGAEGARALPSCELYGQLAAGIGHANHMPGHIYSRIGMWHEGAYWMERATRIEKGYMQRQLIFPFNNWNYAHNVNYMAYILEQLGRADAAVAAAWDLLEAPLDPQFNAPTETGYSCFRQGLRSLCRALGKFERWETILEADAIPWRDSLEDEVWRAYLEGRAHIGLRDMPAAIASLIELRELGEALEGANSGNAARYHELMLLELHGRVLLAQGKELEGLAKLSAAAEQQWQRHEEDNDPPSLPTFLYTSVGERYLETGNAALALKAFERTLEKVPNDAFALAGLARAQHALHQMDEARRAYARLLHVWAGADGSLHWMDDAAALGFDDVQPLDDSPRSQRVFDPASLADAGPLRWQPYAAPRLEAFDPDEERASLAEYRGRNVLLVFYLGGDCAHCVEQLQAISERATEFSDLDVELLAISSDSPEVNRDALSIGEHAFRLLSDIDFQNARRFRSYDDFEELELHSTILIDAQGRVRWARTGGDPFMELDFLLGEIERINAGTKAVPTSR
jgi:peroxiredoxin/tetratricopeptide (TPR) repeat protein